MPRVCRLSLNETNEEIVIELMPRVLRLRLQSACLVESSDSYLAENTKVCQMRWRLL